jgi:hypothetical protein
LRIFFATYNPKSDGISKRFFEPARTRATTGRAGCPELGRELVAPGEAH